MVGAVALSPVTAAYATSKQLSERGRPMLEGDHSGTFRNRYGLQS